MRLSTKRDRVLIIPTIKNHIGITASNIEGHGLVAMVAVSGIECLSPSAIRSGAQAVLINSDIAAIGARRDIGGTEYVQGRRRSRVVEGHGNRAVIAR